MILEKRERTNRGTRTTDGKEYEVKEGKNINRRKNSSQQTSL